MTDLTAAIEIAPAAELHELRATAYESSAMQNLHSETDGVRPNWILAINDRANIPTAARPACHPQTAASTS